MDAQNRLVRNEGTLWMPCPRCGRDWPHPLGMRGSSQERDFTCCVCASLKVGALKRAMRSLLSAHEALMPGLQYIAVQDYALQNEAPIEARKALADD